MKLRSCYFVTWVRSGFQVSCGNYPRTYYNFSTSLGDREINQLSYQAIFNFIRLHKNKIDCIYLFISRTSKFVYYSHYIFLNLKFKDNLGPRSKGFFFVTRREEKRQIYMVTRLRGSLFLRKNDKFCFITEPGGEEQKILK